MLVATMRLHVFIFVLAAGAVAAAQRPQLANGPREFVSVDAAVVALTHVRVIDGTGAAPREDQTVVIRDGNHRGDRGAASTPPPAGATVIDLTGKSRDPRPGDGARAPLLPDGPRRLRPARRELLAALPRRRRDDDEDGREREWLHGPESEAAGRRAGQPPGPAIDATAPYLNGPNTFLQMRALEGCGRCAPPGRVLGRHGRDLVQGLHADHARRSSARRSTKRTRAA